MSLTALGSQVDRVAAGIAYDPTVQVLALHARSSTVRYWAREVLDVSSFPTVLALPADVPSVFKLHDSRRTESGILEFASAAFRRPEAARLQMRPVPRTSFAATTGGALPRSARLGTLSHSRTWLQPLSRALVQASRGLKATLRSSAGACCCWRRWSASAWLFSER